MSEVEQLELQYEIANSLYEDVVPRSLEYYLGVVGVLNFGGEELNGLG